MGLADDGFLRRAKVTNPAAQIPSGGVSNYSIILNEDSIGASHAFWSEVQADGGDIRVSTDQAGDTRLAVDVISIDTSGKTIQLAIQPQSLSSVSANEFWLWWDHASTQTQPARTDTYGRDNAYHSSLVSYWPLEEDPSGSSPQMSDRTADDNGLTSNGTMTGDDSIASKVGNGLDFDGTDDYAYLSILDYRSGDSSGAISAWVKATANSEYPFCSADEATGASYYLGLRLDGSSRPAVAQRNVDVTATATEVRGDTALSSSAWSHVVLASTGTAYKIYVNGVAESLTVVTGSNDGDWFADTANRDNLSIGAFVGSSASNFLGGAVDEVMVFSAEPSQATVTTLYNNTNAPGTFASLGAAENTTSITSMLALMGAG